MAIIMTMTRGTTIMTTILEFLLPFPCVVVPYVGGEEGAVAVGGYGEGVSGTGV